MTSQNSWTLGEPGSFWYKIYDRLRQYLDGRLVGYLSEKTIHHDRVRILEAGSGPASASSLFTKDNRVKLSVAADWDIEALYVARMRDPHLTVVVADLYNLPFASDSLDLVWNNSTLDHLEKPLAAVMEMQRITHREGYVFIGVPNLYGPLGFQKWIPDTTVGIWIGRVFGELELKNILQSASLAPQDVLYYFFHIFVGVFAQKKNLCLREVEENVPI